MKNIQPTDQPDTRQLLDLRFTPAQFTLLDKSIQPKDLTRVMKVYSSQLQDLGFIYSHKILIEHCIGKAKPARMLVFLHPDQNAYALLTDLYHEKSWVYFTHYLAAGKRVITTCQPGSLMMGPLRPLPASADYVLQNTGAGMLKSANLNRHWKKHQNYISANHATDKALSMDPNQHLDTEREAYTSYTNLLLDCVILRQSDTQLVGFTHTGADSFYAAVTSKSAKRPNTKVNKPVTRRNRNTAPALLNFRNGALAASVAVFGVLAYNLATYTNNNAASTDSTSINLTDNAPLDEAPVTTPAVIPTPTITAETIEKLSDESNDIATNQADQLPEQFIVASEEDELWRIAVENAEFYLMSNDGDPAPWISTARKMAAGFKGDDPRLARTHFLTALLESDPQVAEQKYNRALKIQTSSLGLYHAETAQTLEALAWVAEGARDDIDEAITHQRLALNVYRSIFGEEAEDTRAARWKLQYFEDRLEGRRPKTDDNRRLLPALARFAR